MHPVELTIFFKQIVWLHVGVLSDGEEILIDGYAWQSDHEGIKASWIANDPESGISGIQYTVGTTPGILPVMSFKPFTSRQNFRVNEIGRVCIQKIQHNQSMKLVF